MIDNSKVLKCACKVPGQRHAFTASTDGKFILMTDPANAHLLQDTGWRVGWNNRHSKRLHARATTPAPVIRVGQQLHRLATKLTKAKAKRVRAINRNLLDCRRANLQVCTRSDISILSRATPATKAVGVHYSKPPRWLKTQCFFHATIRVQSDKVHVGSFATLEEAQAAWDAAARRLHGDGTTTNQSLGLLPWKVARTRLCRNAAKVARSRIAEHQCRVWHEKMKAFDEARTPEERLAAAKAMARQSFKMPSIVSC